MLFPFENTKHVFAVKRKDLDSVLHTQVNISAKCLTIKHNCNKECHRGCLKAMLFVCDDVSLRTI